MKGTLYIVSTPIGNLEDITLRALRVLKEVDVIAAEDTRHSLKLLTHYGIAKPLISYWSEREKVKSEEIIRRLEKGQSVALITDAGTPGISDPGGVVIKRAIDEGFDVIPVPGPSALITALSISGFPLERFTFVGFLPPKASQRLKVLKELSIEKGALVFYEAPHRLIETLEDMLECFGNRHAVVFKELTKIHEKAFRGSLEGIIFAIKRSTIAGEYVIVIGDKAEKEEGKTIDDALQEVMLLIKKGRSRKEAVKLIAETYGLSKKELYKRTLTG